MSGILESICHFIQRSGRTPSQWFSATQKLACLVSKDGTVRERWLAQVWQSEAAKHSLKTIKQRETQVHPAADGALFKHLHQRFIVSFFLFLTRQYSLKCFSEHKALILIWVVNGYLLLPWWSQLWPPCFWSCLWGDSHEEAFALGIFLSWSCSSCFSIHLELRMTGRISQSRWHAEGEKKKQVNHKDLEGNGPLIYFCWSLWQCIWTRGWALHRYVQAPCCYLS